MSPKSKFNDAHKVQSAEAKGAAASLAECFADDVVARYYLQISNYNRPLKPTEEKLNLRIYECLTAAHCCNGLVISAGPSHESVGLWLPPNSDWNWKTYWKSGLWLLWLRLGKEGRARFFGSWDILEEGMTSIMRTRASTTWILTDLGTKKSSRGQGYGTKVMEYGLSLVSLLFLPPNRSIWLIIHYPELSEAIFKKHGTLSIFHLILHRPTPKVNLYMWSASTTMYHSMKNSASKRRARCH